MNQTQLVQDIQQLQQQNAQIIQNLAQVNETLVQVNLRLEKTEHLLSMRLHNSKTLPGAPLQYPPGIAVVPPIPDSKNDLIGLTATQCDTVARLLGLAPAAPGASEEECQQQISDYLGCVL